MIFLKRAREIILFSAKICSNGPIVDKTTARWEVIRFEGSHPLQTRCAYLDTNTMNYLTSTL